MIRVVLLLLFVFSAGPSQADQTSPPGQFDSYLLSLSWSPQYCSAADRPERDPDQCGDGRRFGFVVHGLWPNNNRPPHPRDCAPPSGVPPSLVREMLRIMPSAKLVQHEWDTHGSCSGVNVQDYYTLVRTAFRSVNIPLPYRQPARDLRVSAAEIRRYFEQANPQFPNGGIKLNCSGQFLREVRLCFDKKLNPRACNDAIRDSCGNRVVTLRRVR